MSEFNLIKPLTDAQRNLLINASFDDLQLRVVALNSILFAHTYGSNTMFDDETARNLYSERNHIRKELHRRKENNTL